MTTEIWVTGFYDQSLQTIPDGQRLSSAQKSKLIEALNTYLPQSRQTKAAGLSPDQFGHIIDTGNGSTSISTPRQVDINVGNSDKYPSFHRTWNKPITISRDGDEIAFIIPLGYTRRPISIKNVSQKSS